MRAYYTNNEISHTVLKSLPDIELKHIYYFGDDVPIPSVFYGILRGAGPAMRIMEYLKINYWYIDNGYFDAEYVNGAMQKHMDGKFRVVKNDMIDVYTGPVRNIEAGALPRRALLLPPSQYTAHHYNTTPEDWEEYVKQFLSGWEIVKRYKGSALTLDEQLSGIGLVVSFHSMACMAAIKRGIPAYDTHGIFRNIEALKDQKPVIRAHYEDLQEFYEPKQYTLEEIGKIKWQ